MAELDNASSSCEVEGANSQRLGEHEDLYGKRKGAMAEQTIVFAECYVDPDCLIAAPSKHVRP